MQATTQCPATHLPRAGPPTFCRCGCTRPVSRTHAPARMLRSSSAAASLQAEQSREDRGVHRSAAAGWMLHSPRAHVKACRQRSRTRPTCRHPPTHSHLPRLRSSVLPKMSCTSVGCPVSGCCHRRRMYDAVPRCRGINDVNSRGLVTAGWQRLRKANRQHLHQVPASSHCCPAAAPRLNTYLGRGRSGARRLPRSLQRHEVCEEQKARNLAAVGNHTLQLHICLSRLPGQRQRRSCRRCCCQVCRC